MEPGTMLGGRYELGERLGVGGTAQVYLAQDTLLNAPRAVKVMQNFRGKLRETLRRRLTDEARTMAALNHPNVLSVFDIGSFGPQGRSKNKVCSIESVPRSPGQGG
ncbi:MAG: serine/threonine protein kinase [Myxococcota bacterium]|jgi:serine/threonine protein kinase